ncbi:unnamed protein product [Pylaiella littoralis]
MSQTWFHKPENALKRANELIAINNKPAALELLHSVFTTRQDTNQQRYKTWQTAYETIMLKYMDLCVQLQQHRQAKDGLHQYRNMAQQQAPGSLEVIINYLVDQAEKRATNSRKKADQMSLVEAAKVGDLEAEATPESIMLSTMTEEGEKERTDREMVVPWLKFLWETYRAVLDILKTNTKLEHVYHATCIKAFNFCRTYERTTELRRLCDTLRQHISNLQKHSAAQTTNRLRGWEGWTSDGIELHLQTRFAQLEVAAGLELWTEGFRTVEDIYNIMQIGKKTPKARLMASYYEKLTRIFWVSENYLFHAYAWYKFYSLASEYNKTLTSEAKVTQANCVLLAAISIPQIRSESASQLFDEDDLSKQKNQRMATLLGFSTDPSREALMDELVKKGILAQVSPDVLGLYNIIETNFRPMSIVKDSMPHLDTLTEAGGEVASYVPSLERIVVLRLLAQLSSVYHTVTLERLQTYLTGVRLSFQEVERLIVRAVKQRQVKVTVDHKARCLRFGGEVMESDSMRTQLTTLATQLQKAVNLVKPAEQTSDQQRTAFFGQVVSGMQREHTDALNRKNIIEKRKEETERREQDKTREEARVRQEEDAKRKSEEAARLAREAKLREKEKLQRIERELELQQTKEMLAKLGKKADNVDELDKSGREELIRKTKDTVVKEKEDEDVRMKSQAKRLDYITRALRLEEMPVLRNKYEAQVEADKKEHDRRWEAHLESHKKAWEKDMVDKEAVGVMYEDAEVFQSSILESRQAEHAAEVIAAEERARAHRKQKKTERALARMRKAEEDAELAREEEERQEREAEEASRREALEAERRAAGEEAEATRAAEKQARDEVRERASRGLGPEDEDRQESGGGGGDYDDRSAGGWRTAGAPRGGGGGGGGGGGDKFGAGRGGDDRVQPSRGNDGGDRGGQGGAGDMGRERNFEGGWRRAGGGAGAGGSSSGNGGGGGRFGDRSSGGGGFDRGDRGGYMDRDSGGGGGRFSDRMGGGGGGAGGGSRGDDGGMWRSRASGSGGGGGGDGFDRRDVSRGGGRGFDRRDDGRSGGIGFDRHHDSRGGGGGFDRRDDSRGGGRGFGSSRDGGGERPPTFGQRPVRGQGRSLKDLARS